MMFSSAVFSYALCSQQDSRYSVSESASPETERCSIAMYLLSTDGEG